MSGSFLQWFRAWWKGESDHEPQQDSKPQSDSDALARLLADDDLSWLDSPRDVHSTEAWDKYWYEQVRHGLGPGIFDLFSPEQELIAAMRRRGLTTVLCAGNGISQEPRALAAAGFQVTALDSSPMAMKIAEACDLEPKQLQHFFPPELCAPAGSVDFVVGDLRDPCISPGPFDVVIERRTLQLFQPDERGPALDALANRLGPDGIFVSHCHFGAWRPGQPRTHLFENLFVAKGWTIETGYGSLQSEGRVAWLSLSTG